MCRGLGLGGVNVRIRSGTRILGFAFLRSLQVLLQSHCLALLVAEREAC